MLCCIGAVLASCFTHTASPHPLKPRNSLAVALARAIASAGLGRVEPLTWAVARLWLPVNAIFVLMLATNFYALQTVGVGMVSILKNVTNAFIILGDYVLFRRCVRAVKGAGLWGRRGARRSSGCGCVGTKQRAQNMQGKEAPRTNKPPESKTNTRPINQKTGQHTAGPTRGRFMPCSL